jgi:hypothetical protein
MELIRFTHPALTNPETDEPIVLRVPATVEVCPTCGGRGRHFRSDLDENRLLDLMSEDGDEEGIEDYHRGRFDQTCTECKGRNVVDAVDWDLFGKKWPDYLQQIEEYYQEQYAHQCEVAAERRLFGN